MNYVYWGLLTSWRVIFRKSSRHSADKSVSNERGFPGARDLDRLWRHESDLMPVSPIVDTWAPRFMSYGTFTASKINGMMLRPSVTLFIALTALSSHNCILSLMNCRLSWVGRQSQLCSLPVQLEITLHCWHPSNGCARCCFRYSKTL